jgi:DNA invertase Pin-like site-specific DNA recombinase
MFLSLDTSSKITRQHRERQAFVYIRQSTMKQVASNFESQDMQYQLTKRAEALGWPADQVVVIDDDLGKSGASAAERTGFHMLVAEVGLSHAGMILVTDVSRLARNCADWYQLLDLASLSGTLISDASGIFEPRNFDDRLLLGMKGTFAEAQWFTMRAQLSAARHNKAARGELNLPIPVGYDRLPNGKTVKTADMDVRSAIDLIFAQFNVLGSARQVLRYFRTHELKMPRVRGAGAMREVVWVKANYQMIYNCVTQATYTGTYCYGRHHSMRAPGAAKKVIQQAVPVDQWPVVIHNAFEAYISWDQYMRNGQILHNNALKRSGMGTSGAAGGGHALLAGLVTCGRCGQPMHVHYSHSSRYLCDQASRAHDEARCQSITLQPIDRAVVNAFLQALQPAQVATAVAAAAEIDAQKSALAKHWRLRIERAQYESELARKRYEKVDPDLRLVASELERSWNDKLTVLTGLQREWTLVQAAECAPLTVDDIARIEALSQNIPTLWQSPATTMEDRKRLLRCLIQDVTLDTQSRVGVTVVHIRWATGTTSTLEVTRPKIGGPGAPKEIAERIRVLCKTHADAEIADILNKESIRMARDLGPWTRKRVSAFRAKQGIETDCPYATRACTHTPRGDGLYKVSDVAAILRTTNGLVHHWYYQGLLTGTQVSERMPVWLRFDDDDRRQLDGSAKLMPAMLSLRKAMKRFELTPDTLRRAITDRHLFAYRLIHGQAWRWFILPAASGPFSSTSDSRRGAS